MSNEHPAKILIIIQDYANVWAINKSKSLPGFRVVTSLDGIKGWSIQTLLRGRREEKTTRSNRLKFRATVFRHAQTNKRVIKTSK